MPYKLRPRQIKAAHMLARGCTIAEIDRTLKLRRGTLMRWRQSSAFILEYGKAREELREMTDFRKAQLLDKSVEALYSQLGSYYCDPKVVLAALNVFKSVLNAPELARTDPIMSENVPDD